MDHTVRLAALALASLMLTACQGSSETPAAPTVGATSTSPRVTGASDSGPLATRGAPTAVEGRDYTTLYTVDPRGSAGARVGVRAIREDGSAVIFNSPPPASGELIAQSQAGIQTVKSRTWLAPQTGAQPRQDAYAAADGQSFVWLETKSTDLFYLDWKVFAARPGQAKPTLLGDSFDLTKTDKIPPPPGVKVITTDGVHAWWTMTHQTGQKDVAWGVRIMVRDIAGREPLTTAVEKAKLPAATGGGIAYVRSRDVDPGAPANRYDIRLRQAGADTLVTSGQLVKDEQVSTMCASDSLLAWAVRSAEAPAEAPASASPLGRLHVIDLATKAKWTIALDDSAGSLDLSCGDTFVAWGNGSGNGDPAQYAFDVPSGKLWKLGESPGISVVHAAGAMLGWTLPPVSAQDPAPIRITKWHAR